MFDYFSFAYRLGVLENSSVAPKQTPRDLGVVTQQNLMSAFACITHVGLTTPHVRKVPIADSCTAAKRDSIRSPRRHKFARAHSGNPALRRPSFCSFEFDCPPRAMYADIVKAGSVSSRCAAASRASASRLRRQKRDSGKLAKKRGSGVGLSSLRRWPRQSDEAR